MQIGIIGAGKIGGTLTRRLTALGHTVRVANSRAPETLTELASETGAQAVWAADAAADADLVIVSIPERAVPQLVAGIVDARKTGAPVIETNNYYPQRDGRIERIEDGTPESVWVSEHLGTPDVYKAFNGIFWKHLVSKASEPGSPERVALPVAGRDGANKELVFALVDELGFDPVDGGTLEESWRQQPGTPVYGTDLDREGVREGLARAPREGSARFRAEH